MMIRCSNFYLKSVCSTIISNIQKSLGKGLGLIIDSAVDHKVKISKYQPLIGSSYIILPTELDYIRKGLINIQDINANG